MVVDRQQPEVGAGALGDVLPGNEVRVVLELGHEHDVTRPEVVEAPGVGDEVDRLRRAAGEDHLARGGRIDELARRLACALVRLGRPLREQIDAAVHVRVRGLVEVADRVQHLARLLRAGRRVEIRERLSVDLLLEDREVGAQLLRVEGWASRHGHRAIVPRHRVMKLSATTAVALRDSPARSGLRRLGHDLELTWGEGVRQCRLRRLPHAQGRGVEGPGRAQPRRAEARPVDRRAAGAPGRERHALVRQEALERPDRAGGVVRLVGRAQLGNELRLQARQDDDRRVRAERQAFLLPAGVRQPHLQGGAREGARPAGDRRLAHQRRPRRLPPDLALDRARRARLLQARRRPGALARSDDVQLGLLPRRPPGRAGRAAARTWSSRSRGISAARRP